MSTVSTHVLDTSLGHPGRGIGVRLERLDEAVSLVATGVTDDDGRVGDLGPDDLAPGTYRLVFASGDYFAGLGIATFFPEVQLVFTVAVGEHYHVPVLLSPFAYSTYRGS